MCTCTNVKWRSYSNRRHYQYYHHFNASVVQGRYKTKLYSWNLTSFSTDCLSDISVSYTME